MAGTVSTVFGVIKAIGKGVFDYVDSAAAGIKKVIKEANGIWDTYEEQVAELARTAGMSVTQFQALEVEFNKMALKLDAAGTNMVAKFGKNAADMAKWTAELAQNIGRNVTWTQEQYENYAALSKYAGDVGESIMMAFQNLGVDSVQTGERLSGVLNETMSTGINFNKVLKNINDNAKTLNSLTFKNGINGFTEMAKQAANMNFNMGETIKLAEKIQEGDFNNLAEMSSRLQVLGGSFAQFANPLEMLYEGTSDVGALQDRIINMFKGKGTFNERTGQVELGRFEKMQVQQAANALGIDAQEAFKMINTSAIKDRVNQQINIGSLSGNKEQAEADRLLIQNSATLDKNGNAMVRIGTETKDVRALTQQDVELLRNMKDTDEKQSIFQIAQDVRSIAEVEKANEAQTEEYGRQLYQDDIRQGFNSMASGVLTMFSSFDPQLLGGGITKKVQELASNLREAADTKTFSTEGLANKFDKIASNMEGRLGGFSGESRKEAEGLVTTMRNLANTVRNGKISAKTARTAFAQAEQNPLLSKLTNIWKVIDDFRTGMNERLDAKGKTHASGGLVSVPYSEGGMIPGVESGGYLKDIFPNDTPLRQETPFAVTKEHSTGGNMVVETAQPSEYIIRESSVNKYTPSVLDSVNKGTATIIPHDDGGYTQNVRVNTNALGGTFNEQRSINEVSTNNVNHTINEHKQSGTIMLQFAKGGITGDERMLQEILTGVRSLLSNQSYLSTNKPLPIM